MQPIFEAKYLAIKWFDKNTVSSITEAIIPIEIKVQDSNNYHIEIQTYTRIEDGSDGQIAFRLLDYTSEIFPYFIDASNAKVNLFKIIDPNTKKEWWIEKSSWKKDKNGDRYWASELWNHTGEATVYFGNIACHINARAMSFTKEQLNLYLEDFRNDFWYLILKKNSLTRADARNNNEQNKLLNEDTIKLLKAFIKNVQDILKNPKKELKEVQGLKDLKQVKPVAKTFMEIATCGIKRKLTSRDTLESYNVPENRYVHYATYQVYVIVSNIIKASSRTDKFFRKKIDSDQKKVHSFGNTVTINKEALENSIKDLEVKLEKQQAALNNILSLQNDELRENLELAINNGNPNLRNQTIFVHLQTRQRDYDEKIQFWGKARLPESTDWYWFDENDSLSLEFDNVFDGLLNEHTIYKITAYIERNEYLREQGGIIYKRYFRYVSNIEIVSSSELENLLKEKTKLEATNWTRELRPNEKQQQEKEKESIQKQIKLWRDVTLLNAKYIKDLEPIFQSLSFILNQFKKLSISKDSYFPNSMTFIQNPHYQGAYKHHELIKNIVEIDEDLFMRIQIVDQIGILDIPTLYERWCLLQIIKTLTDQFRFVPESSWKSNLIKQILSNPNEPRNISIQFENKEIQRTIGLCYEKVLDNNKRPDFVLDILSTKTQKSHRLVMDAKFHENVNIEALIDELYNKKNYSENSINTVFIIHPDSKKSIKHVKTPAEWGSDSYYGEVEMFDYEWDSSLPEHKYGSILLSPIRDDKSYGYYLDNLQRLIALAMQYQMEDNKDLDKLGDVELRKDMLNPIPKEKGFCVKCGSGKITGRRENSNKGYFYSLECKECSHNFVYFYCWNCKNRLIKNGRYWNYHSSHATEPFDIKCPHCGRYWYQMGNQREQNAQ